MTTQPVTPPDPHPSTQAQAEDLGFDLPPPATMSWPRAAVIGSVGLAVLAGAFVFGYLPRRADRTALVGAMQASDGALARVQVVAPKEASSDRAVSLPGSVQPLEETVIYARASGYVRKWYVDIGDKVTGGQVLVDLDTPELDQELDQARAQLTQAEASLVQMQANAVLSKSNLTRYKQLAPSGVVSAAELDQRNAMAQVDEASVSVAQATIAAQQANIRRITQLKGFSHVTAPFGGTVTQRTIEIGSLVSAGNGQPMYKVASMDPARVFIQVPQDVAPGVRAGIPANVTVREYPGRTFAGTVSRAAGELDALTRTMNTEVRVPNGDGALIAGMYAEVALTLPSPHRVYQIPSTALMSDSRGNRVAVVDDQDVLHLVPVVVERDSGPTLDIASGIAANDRVVALASAQFVEGAHVEVTK